MKPCNPLTLAGSTDFAHTPIRVEPLADLKVVQVVCAKYHSAAISSSGQLFTWGWGRGGRLGEHLASCLCIIA